MVTWNNPLFGLMRDLDSMRREIDRTFEDAGRGWVHRPMSRVSFLPGRATRRYPLINIHGDEQNVYVEALAPGVDPESFDVSVKGDQLTISGEKAPANGDVKAEEFHRTERSAGKFIRTFTLPSEIDQDKVQANYKNGLLLVTLPKAESAKPKEISVKVE